MRSKPALHTAVFPHTQTAASAHKEGSRLHPQPVIQTPECTGYLCKSKWVLHASHPHPVCKPPGAGSPELQPPGRLSFLSGRLLRAFTSFQIKFHPKDDPRLNLSPKLLGMCKL